MSHTNDWRLNVSSFGKNWNRSRPRGRVFRSIKPVAKNAVLSGITRDLNEAPLGNCTVDMFKTNTDEKVATVVSDGQGNFSFVIAPVSGPFYLVAYLAGSPDVAGTTVNTLVTV